MNIRKQLRGLVVVSFTSLVVLGVTAGYGFERFSELLVRSNNEAIFYESNVNISRQAQVEFQRQVQEWKNILIRGNDSSLYSKYFTAFVDHEAKMDQNLSILKKNLDAHGDSSKEVQELLDVHKELGGKYRAALDNSWNDSDEQAGKKVDLLVRGIDRDTSKRMDDLAQTLQKTSEDKLNEIKTEAANNIRMLTGLLAIVALSTLALLIMRAGLIIKKVMLLLGAEPAELVAVFRTLASGDFTANVPLAPNDKTSMTAQIALMQRKMRNMVSAVKNGTNELQTLANVLEATDAPMSPKKFAESTNKAVTGLTDAISRFKVE